MIVNVDVASKAYKIRKKGHSQQRPKLLIIKNNNVLNN
jgi:hypothetical protein